MPRGQIKLTERSDGTFYLQCRCGEIGQPCRYQGEVTFTVDGLTLLRQARKEAFEHCWTEHRISAADVHFDLLPYHEPVHTPVDAKPFLVTTEPLRQIVEALSKKVRPA